MYLAKAQIQLPKNPKAPAILEAIKEPSGNPG